MRLFSTLQNIIRSPNTLRIASILPGTFKLSNNQLVNSSLMATMDSRFFRWNISSAAEINVDSLSAALMIKPVPELVIVGTGSTMTALPEALHKELNENGITLQVENTV